jgi:hypothetical protein
MVERLGPAGAAAAKSGMIKRDFHDLSSLLLWRKDIWRYAALTVKIAWRFSCVLLPQQEMARL